MDEIIKLVKTNKKVRIAIASLVIVVVIIAALAIINHISVLAAEKKAESWSLGNISYEFTPVKSVEGGTKSEYLHYNDKLSFDLENYNLANTKSNFTYKIYDEKSNLISSKKSEKYDTVIINSENELYDTLQHFRVSDSDFDLDENATIAKVTCIVHVVGDYGITKDLSVSKILNPAINYKNYKVKNPKYVKPLTWTYSDNTGKYSSISLD